MNDLLKMALDYHKGHPRFSTDNLEEVTCLSCGFHAHIPPMNPQAILFHWDETQSIELVEDENGLRNVIKGVNNG
jgi:hypothetical protein